MSDSYDGWTSYYSLVIPHPSEPAVLMTEDEGIHSLPTLRIEDFCWYRHTGEASRFVFRESDREWRILRCVSCVDDFADRISRRVYLVHNPYPVDAMEGEWVHRPRLTEARLSNPEHKPMIRGCLDEIGGRSTYHRPEWTMSRWWEPTVAWFEDQLTTLGCEPLSRVTQEYSWPLSSILRARTSSGDHYLKACSRVPPFVNEPVLTERLSTLFPDWITAPLVTNPERRWMILPGLGYPIRDASDDEKAEVLLAFGRLQVASVQHVRSLLEIGCPDRRPGALEREIGLMIRVGGVSAGLDQDEQARLQAAEPLIAKRIDELSEYGLPSVVAYGNLHLGNVSRPNGQLQFFDWGQGCVAHPFLDIWSFVQESELDSWPIDEYLALWDDHVPGHWLREALSLAEGLGGILEMLDQFHACVQIRPEPEELPDSLLRGLRALMDSFAETC